MIYSSAEYNRHKYGHENPGIKISNQLKTLLRVLDEVCWRESNSAIQHKPKTTNGGERGQPVFPDGTGYLVKTENLTQKNLTEVTEPSISE